MPLKPQEWPFKLQKNGLSGRHSELKGLGRLRFEARGDFASENQGNALRQYSQRALQSKKFSPWKSKFLYRYRPEGIFRIFFGLILDPPRYICFYSEKRQIHLYRPFFSPWHGLFRKKGGTRAGIRFYFP